MGGSLQLAPTGFVGGQHFLPFLRVLNPAGVERLSERFVGEVAFALEDFLVGLLVDAALALPVEEGEVGFEAA